MRLLAPCAFFFSVAICTVAHAGTATIFDFSGTLQTGTVQGTITIDTTTGTFLSSDFTVSAKGTDYVFDSPTVGGQGIQGGYYYGIFLDPVNDEFVLGIPGTSLVGFTGGEVCDNESLCTFNGVANVSSGLAGIDGSANFLVSGRLTPAASPVPEPSSIALIGTGLLGLAGIARRKFFADPAR